MSESNGEGLKGRLTRQGEEALAKLAQDLMENELVSSALMKAFGARERASQAQDAAMAALNIPSASDLERLTRRIRSVSQRLESVEDVLDRIEDRIQRIDSTTASKPKPAAAKPTVAKKPAAKRPVATKATAAKRPAAKRAVAKAKPVAAKPAAVKTAAKKPAKPATSKS